MTKRIPNLQVALDHSDLQGAIKAAVSVGQEVDIIEAGTVCLLQVGSELVEVLRSLFPDKIIVADTKCADASWSRLDDLYLLCNHSYYGSSSKGYQD